MKVDIFMQTESIKIFVFPFLTTFLLLFSINRSLIYFELEKENKKREKFIEFC